MSKQSKEGRSKTITAINWVGFYVTCSVLILVILVSFFANRIIYQIKEYRINQKSLFSDIHTIKYAVERIENRLGK